MHVLACTLRDVSCVHPAGAGMKEFFAAVAEAENEYYDEYLPELQARWFCVILC